MAPFDNVQNVENGIQSDLPETEAQMFSRIETLAGFNCLSVHTTLEYLYSF